MKLFLKQKRIKFQSSVLTHLFLWVSMFLLSGQTNIFANNELSAPATLQARTVQGIVTDDFGDPLPGVNITIKGTSAGVMSGPDGSFSINVPNDNAVLVFSYIGFVRQEITVGNQRNINIGMKEDTQQIEEVVVIGYGTQSREMLTTSISKVDNKVLENIPYTNATSALQGAVSGVRVQSVSGQPGATARIIIRGGTSINSPDAATPLYIIDGVVRTDIADIATDDIASIQVLKDAAATSIYGARGSNGVVIITSKRGKAGKTSINYRYDMTVSNQGKMYEMANASEYITLHRKGHISNLPYDHNARLNGANGYGVGNNLLNNTAFSTQYLTPENQYKLNEGWQQMPDPVDPSKTLIFSDTDFQKLTYRTGFSHNHYFDTSGGNDKVTFNTGLGYMTTDGTLVNTDYSRMSFNIAGTFQATERLSFTGRVVYSDAKTRGNPMNSDANTFYRSAAFSPTGKMYFEDGTLSPGMASNIGNPLYWLKLYKRESQSENMTATLSAEWKILPKLTFSPHLSLYNVNRTEETFTPAFWNGVSSYNTTRTATAAIYKWKQYQAEGVFNYMDTFGTDHNVSGMAGLSYFNRRRSEFSANGRGASSDLIPTLNASAEPTAVSSTHSDHVMIGYFGRISYNYKYKYLLTANARYDGASNLGNDHKWGFFPGVSLGWHLNKEDFWNFLPEDLLKVKLRASYGINGNISGLGDFTAQGAYSVGSIYMGNAAVFLSTMANQDLRWERSKTFDLGTDLDIFNGRVNILFDWFHRVTDNLITNFSLPASTGFSSIQTNYGSLQNRGVELEISTDVLPKTSPAQWNVSFNASKVSNKIIKLPENGIENNRVGGIYIWDDKLGDYAWKGGTQEGGRIGDMFTYKHISIYATDEEARNGPQDMLITTAGRPKYGGDTNWLDTDGNGIIDDRDRVYIGNRYPSWTGGLSNTIDYKGFSFYLRLDYTVGHNIFNYAKLFIDGNLYGDNNMSKDMVRRSWKEQGDIAELPRFCYGGEGSQHNTYRGGYGSDFYNQKGDFLCIREASLSYSVPSALLNRMYISGLRFSVTGNNLHYFTKYVGLNPEDGGQDNGRYAMPKNIIFSAKISF